MSTDAVRGLTRPAAPGRLILDLTDSTNAHALRLAAGGAPSQWILALAQSAARGRRGRAWAMPAGNFAATLLLYPDGPAGQVALRSFVAALALDDALVAAGVAPAALALKWPNDVLLNGGKLAGILLESTSRGPGVAALAIGFGVNLAAAPDAASIEPGALAPRSLGADLGLSIAPAAFLDRLAAAYEAREAQFLGQGFAPIRDGWLARAAGLGQRIRARTGSTERHGIFEGIDDAGNLLLRTGAGLDRVGAAEIFF